MAEYYEFVTVWRLDAPIEKVWEQIKDFERWSDWWRGVVKVGELKAGDPEGIGKIVRSTKLFHFFTLSLSIAADRFFSANPRSAGRRARV